MAAARRRGGMRTHPGACGRGNAEHAVAERRKQRPRDRMKLAGRDDNDWCVAQVACCRAKERVLEFRSGSFQYGYRAVHLVLGPATGEAAQGKAGEVGSAHGILGTACRELPY